jgi:uncharacterized membrane protein
VIAVETGAAERHDQIWAKMAFGTTAGLVLFNYALLILDRRVGLLQPQQRVPLLVAVVVPGMVLAAAWAPLRVPLRSVRRFLAFSASVLTVLPGLLLLYLPFLFFVFPAVMLFVAALRDRPPARPR